MNAELENAIKKKIAIEMIGYLGYDSIEDLSYNIQYPIMYKELIKDKETIDEIANGYKEYGFDNADNMTFEQAMTVATVIVFEKYFSDDFECDPFTIDQFKAALKILKLDVFDVLEMKYIFNM